MNQVRAGPELLWSPGGRWLASSTDDGTAKVWEAATGKEVLGFDFGDAYSQRRRLAAWSGDDRYLALWLPAANPFDPAPLQIYEIPSGKVVTSVPAQWLATCDNLAWSPDGRHLAVAGPEAGVTGNEYRVKVYDLVQRRRVSTLSPDRRMPSILSWSPDGKRLLVNGAVWDASSQGLTPIGASEQPPWASQELVWKPDGTQLAGTIAAASGRGVVVKIWDAVSGKEIRSLPPGVVDAVSQFRKEQERTRAEDVGSLQREEQRRRVEEQRGFGAELVGGDERIPVTRDVSFFHALTWSATGLRLLLIKDGHLEALNPEAPRREEKVNPPVKGPPGGPGLLQPGGNLPRPAGGDLAVEKFLWSSDGRYLATIGRFGVQVRDVASAQVVREFTTYGEWWCWSPDGKHAAWQSSRVVGGGGRNPRFQNVLYMCDVGKAVQEDRELSVGPLQNNAQPQVLAPVWSSDGKYLAALFSHSGGSRFETIRVWDASGKNDREFSVGDIRISTVSKITIDWSPESKLLVLFASSNTSQDRSYRVWEMATGKQVWSQAANWSSAPVWSPDGKWLAGSNWEGITVLNGATGDPVMKLSGKYPSEVSWSPDGQRVIVRGVATDEAGRSRPEVVVWDIQSGAEVVRLQGDIVRGQLTADRQWWASARSADGTVTLVPVPRKNAAARP
jgi:WD40 repeat protein